MKDGDFNRNMRILTGPEETDPRRLAHMRAAVWACKPCLITFTPLNDAAFHFDRAGNGVASCPHCGMRVRCHYPVRMRVTRKALVFLCLVFLLALIGGVVLGLLGML